jgi:hypothetical protein
MTEIPRAIGAGYQWQVLIKPGQERRSLEQSENVGTDHQEGKGSERATGSNQNQPERKLARETGALKKRKRKWKRIQSQPGGSQE